MNILQYIKMSKVSKSSL